MQRPDKHKTTWKNWLLLAVGLWAFLVPSWALVPGNPTLGPKNRVWDFFAKTAISCLANPFVSLTLASGKVACGEENRVGPNCCGEQWDADLGLYYNRARYLNTDSGRFWTMDTFEGRSEDPAGLHKYLYASSNPVRFSDPDGHESLMSVGMTTFVVGVLAYITTPTVLNAPGPNDPTYSDTSLQDLAINMVGGKLIGDYIISPLVKYSISKVGNFMFPKVLSVTPSPVATSALGTSISESFEGGVFRKIVTSTKMIVYRAEGGTSGTFGRFFGTEKPLSAIDAETMSNIAKWGNTIERVSTYEIPAGTTIYMGRVAGGAGEQIFIAEPLKAGVELISTEPLAVGLKGYGL